MAILSILQEKKIFPTGIDGIAVEKYFYDADFTRGQIIENYLTQIETEGSSIIKSIISNNCLDDLKEQGQMILSRFIAAQFFRTKESRERSKDYIRVSKNQFLDTEITDSMKKTLEDLSTEDGIKNYHLSQVQRRIESYYIHFMNKNWTLYINMTKYNYCTSDHPVVLNNQYTNNSPGTMALAHKGIEIYFPLSPKLCLQLRDTEVYPKADSSFPITSESNVIDLNQLQVFNSFRHIFSIDTDFSFVNRVIDEFPDFSNPNRERYNAA